jgi:hypothetical protein
MLANCNYLSKKRKESKALVSCIKYTSFEMFLCSRYKQYNTKYIVSNKKNSSVTGIDVCTHIAPMCFTAIG